MTNFDIDFSTHSHTRVPPLRRRVSHPVHAVMPPKLRISWLVAGGVWIGVARDSYLRYVDSEEYGSGNFEAFLHAELDAQGVRARP